MEFHTDERALQTQLQNCPNLAATCGLIMMSTLMVMTMIVANLAATKIWGPSFLPIDGGLLLFPISYIIGDLLVEIYGKKTADTVAYASAIAGALTVAIIFLVRCLPDYTGADNSGFISIAMTIGRVFMASIVGFLASQLVNNTVFERVRKKQRTESFEWPAFVSSAVAHIPDILLFEPIAFLGKLSLREFVVQSITAYILAIVLEVVLLKLVTKHLARMLIRRMNFRHGKRVHR